MGYLKKYIKKYWKIFLLAVLFLTGEAMCDLLQPTIMSRIIDVGVKNKDINYVLGKGGTMILVALLGAVAATMRNIIASNVSQRFGAELRLDLFKKVNSLSFDNMNKFEGATLVTRLTNDVTQVQNFFAGMMRIFAKAPILCIGSVVMAVSLNKRMSLILIAVIPIVGFIISMNMKVGYPFFIKVQKALDTLNSVMREYLSGVRVVKAFNRFEYEVGRFHTKNEELSSASVNANRVSAVFSPAVSLTVNLGVIAVLWLGGIGVNSGNMKVGQTIAFINYMTQILFSLNIISNVFNQFIRAKASAERIGSVFNEENTIEVLQSPSSPETSTGSVDFEGVCFAYRGSSGELALKNINLTCESGKTIGIIGSTGSGKSSLANLIPRFYDVTSGTVKVDKVDVRDMDPKALRERIAVVPQKTVLFTGTIKENILWGKEDATDEEVELAAKMAQAYEFIEKTPEGYETKLGQGGVNLSGGQKQRMAIARALIRKPEILILDDCTSAVDVATEARIKESLRKYSKGLTTIMIAQRITSVMDADKIVVLDQGEVVGMGTHEELVRNCQIYREIFYSQIGQEVAANG